MLLNERNIFNSCHLTLSLGSLLFEGFDHVIYFWAVLVETE